MNAHAQKLGLALAGTMAAALLTAQTPSSGPILSLSATTQNISGANDNIRQLFGVGPEMHLRVGNENRPPMRSEQQSQTEINMTTP